MSSEQTAVLIAGAGPVGLILAHILGRAGVETLVIDSLARLPDEPRAVGLDPETLRTLQNLDLLEVLDDDLLQGMTGGYYNGAGELLFEISDDSPGPLGYAQLAGFNQPQLVRKLAAELARYPSVELRFEHSLESFSQDVGGVTVQLRRTGDSLSEIRAQYMVGCDGGRSTVRRLLGIRMEGESNSRPWLVIDTFEKEYDGLRKYRFFCDPARPGMFIQTPHNNRRWEWMLLPGENRDEFLTDEKINALLSPHVDVETIDIYRRRVYDFHAIVAERFREGRVFLAGDAAHMTPPFAGQGLNSGVRDAANLGWKLAGVVLGDLSASVLDSYDRERLFHAKQLIDVAVTLGDQIQPTDPQAAAQRDAGFAELNKDPDALQAFLDAIFAAMLDRYFSEGLAVGLGGQFLAGRMISQPEVSGSAQGSTLLDEYLGQGFAIVGYNCEPEEELGSQLAELWRERGVTLVGLHDDGSDGVLQLPAESHLAELFAQGDANLALIRPDRFCMAAFDRGSATQALAQSAAMLGLH